MPRLNFDYEQEQERVANRRRLTEDFRRIPNSKARVVEWQTRTFEGRMPKGMRVQVPPRAPNRRSICSVAGQLFDLASIAYRFRLLS
jgi:hypothetical protein